MPSVGCSFINCSCVFLLTSINLYPPMFPNFFPVTVQEDLIKVLKNCCIYNGEGSDYYHYAVNIWEGLNNIFKEACKEEGIMVPRRWT